MFIYKHEVQYYETDRMGITHHSIMFDGWRKLEHSFLGKLVGLMKE